MARLDWEQAARRERLRLSPSRSSDRRTLALIEFAWKHGLSCFACGAKDAQWAKSGTSKKRGPWIVCVGCVDKRQAEQARRPHR